MRTWNRLASMLLCALRDITLMRLIHCSPVAALHQNGETDHGETNTK